MRLMFCTLSFEKKRGENNGFVTVAVNFASPGVRTESLTGSTKPFFTLMHFNFHSAMQQISRSVEPSCKRKMILLIVTYNYT